MTHKQIKEAETVELLKEFTETINGINYSHYVLKKEYCPTKRESKVIFWIYEEILKRTGVVPCKKEVDAVERVLGITIPEHRLPSK